MVTSIALRPAHTTSHKGVGPYPQSEHSESIPAPQSSQETQLITSCCFLFPLSFFTRYQLPLNVITLLCETGITRDMCSWFPSFSTRTAEGLVDSLSSTVTPRKLLNSVTPLLQLKTFSVCLHWSCYHRLHDVSSHSTLTWKKAEEQGATIFHCHGLHEDT